MESKTLQYHLFKQVGQYFPALVLVALAKGYSLEMQQGLIRTYLDESSPISHPKAVLSGRELIQSLDLTPGPQIGQLLSMIAVAQAEGIVKSSEDAIAFVKKQL